MASADTLALVGGFNGERKTSVGGKCGVSPESCRHASSIASGTFLPPSAGYGEGSHGELEGSTWGDRPLLPGTRTMYSTSGSSFFCVGFRGYAGGFEAIAVTPDKERASTGPLGNPWVGRAAVSPSAPGSALVICQGGGTGDGEKEGSRE